VFVVARCERGFEQGSAYALTDASPETAVTYVRFVVDSDTKDASDRGMCSGSKHDISTRIKRSGASGCDGVADARSSDSR